MAAIQRQLGEGDEGKAAEIAELDKAIVEARMPKEVEDQARKELRRLQRMPEAAGEYGMVRTYLDWLVELPWALPEEKPIDIAEARQHPRRRPFRPREDQAPDHRVSGGAQARAQRQGADPVLRGSARRRQDLARAVDRASHGPQVRARQPRRRARRGRDPRPPADLHRRAAGQHHPGDPQGRIARLRDDARRDRQGRREHPGRPERGAARSARPRAEQHLPRQLPRRAVRSLPRGLHRDREHARHDPGPLARPHGDHQPARLHGEREVPDRAALSRPAPDGGERAQGRTRPRSTTARSGRSSSTTRARRGSANLEREIGRALRQGRDPDRRGRAGADRHCGRRPRRDPRPADLRGRGRHADQRPGRGDRTRLDAGRRRHPVHRGDRHAGRRPAHPHRPARRRDEGERAGGAQHRQEPGGELTGSTRPGSRRPTSTSTCRPARRRRTGRARASPCSWRWCR